MFPEPCNHPLMVLNMVLLEFIYIKQLCQLLIMITIGTDCSGIEAPVEALKQLGIPFQHRWACEIDRFA